MSRKQIDEIWAETRDKGWGLIDGIPDEVYAVWSNANEREIHHLLLAVIHQAVEDHGKIVSGVKIPGESMVSVPKFLETKWGETICENVDLSPDALKCALIDFLQGGYN